MKGRGGFLLVVLIWLLVGEFADFFQYDRLVAQPMVPVPHDLCVRHFGFSLFTCLRPRVGLPLKWILVFSLFGMFRVGEASNPGPDAHFDNGNFTLGTFNPSGMRNKAQYFESHLSYGDVWTISETHFFGKDVSRFRAGLKTCRVQAQDTALQIRRPYASA